MPRGQFTNQDVATLFPASEDQRYGLVKRAIAQGEILRIRRGLYCLNPDFDKRGMSLYALAQHVYGPSYVSLESALSWHGWIPEAVHAVTSVSFKKSKQFQTPVGLFNYERVPQKVFYTAVDRLVAESGAVFLMADPLKALADYVYVRKIKWTGIGPLVDSLRIEPDELAGITGPAIDALLDNYSNSRVRRFLEGLRKDLGL